MRHAPSDSPLAQPFLPFDGPPTGLFARRPPGGGGAGFPGGMWPQPPLGPNPFHLMIKPPPAIAALLHAHPRTDRTRGAGLLHQTVLSFDRSGLTGAHLSEAVALLCGLELRAFRVAFDRIVSTSGTVSLRPGERVAALHPFEKIVKRALQARRVPVAGRGVFPHVTLAYRPDHLPVETIEPISWRVEELLLVESLWGEARHIVHARIPLRLPH